MFPAYFLFIDVCRNLGLRRGVMLAFAWLVRREFFVLVRPLELEAIMPPPDDALRWERFQGDDAALLLRLNPALSEGEISRRLQEGQACELAFDGKSPAHYRWSATASAWLPYLGKLLVGAADDLLITELFTHPAFRRRGIHRQSVRRSVMTARESGARRQVSLVARWNEPVLRTAAKTGARIVGSVGYWNFGVFRRYFAAGAVRLEGTRVLLESSRQLSALRT